MTREKLEREIAAVATDIDLLNRKIDEAKQLTGRRDSLRDKLDELLSKMCLAKTHDTQEPGLRSFFTYKGNIKNLLEALQAEIQKAN